MPGVVNKILESFKAFFCCCNSIDRKLHWVEWEKVLASKEKGDLEISSLMAFIGRCSINEIALLDRENSFMGKNH